VRARSPVVHLRARPAHHAADQANIVAIDPVFLGLVRRLRNRLRWSPRPTAPLSDLRGSLRRGSLRIRRLELELGRAEDDAAS
jgi:hypothetical protein